jgi:hypothetical protein
MPKETERNKYKRIKKNNHIMVAVWKYSTKKYTNAP